MVNPVPEYIDALKAHSNVEGEEAAVVFLHFSQKLMRWQKRQWQSWKKHECKPLERWMRQYIASQYSEFLEFVFWNVPALQTNVYVEREKLRRLQEDRNCHLRAQLLAAMALDATTKPQDPLKYKDCGPVIIGLERDLEADSPEIPRSVIESIRIANTYTRDEYLEDWVDFTGEPAAKRRFVSSTLEWRRDYTSCPESEESGDDDGTCDTESHDDDKSTSSGDDEDSDHDDSLGNQLIEKPSQPIPGSPVYSEVPPDFVVPDLVVDTSSASCA